MDIFKCEEHGCEKYIEECRDFPGKTRIVCRECEAEKHNEAAGIFPEIEKPSDLMKKTIDKRHDVIKIQILSEENRQLRATIEAQKAKIARLLDDNERARRMYEAEREKVEHYYNHLCTRGFDAKYTILPRSGHAVPVVDIEKLGELMDRADAAEARVKELEGAAEADRQRIVDAAIKAGVSYYGCDSRTTWLTASPRWSGSLPRRRI